MARNIARVVHDLKPTMEMISDILPLLAEIISKDQRLQNPQLVKGLERLQELATVSVQYIYELDQEAKRENILK